MRHLMRGRRLNRSSPHRTALFRNLARALVAHERIETTIAKAREIRPYAPKQWPKGTVVTARNESANDKWQPATVVAAFHGLHLVHFDGQDSKVDDQWVAPDCIRVK